MPAQSVASSKVAVVTFSSFETCVGMAGQLLPSASLPPLPSLCTVSRRCESVVAHVEDASAALSLENLKKAVDGDILLTTVSTDVARATLERVVSDCFRMLPIAGLMMVSHPFACAVGSGQSDVRVMEWGLDCLTISYVTGGGVACAVTSRTLGLRRVVVNDSGAEPFGHTVAKMLFPSTSAKEMNAAVHKSKEAVNRLFRQLPDESRLCNVVVTGDALCVRPQLHKDIIEWILEDFVDDEEGPCVLPLARRIRLDPRCVLRLDAAATPGMLPFTGASLLASMWREECDAMLLTREEVEAPNGAALIHSRCPGLVLMDS